MKKNDANSVKGLKEMVEAAFRDLQTGADSLIWGSGSGVATPTDGKHMAPVSTWGHGEVGTPGPVVTSPSRPHPSVRSGKRMSAPTHRGTFCPTGTADMPGGDSMGATVKASVGSRAAPTSVRSEDPTGGRTRVPGSSGLSVGILGPHHGELGRECGAPHAQGQNSMLQLPTEQNYCSVTILFTACYVFRYELTAFWGHIFIQMKKVSIWEIGFIKF